MKKVIAFFLVLTLFSAISLYPALASDYPTDVIYSIGKSEQMVTDSGQDESENSRAYTVVDLGTNGSANIDWTIAGGQTVRSAYNYKTGSGSIVLRLKSSPAGTVVFYLYDTTDTLIGTYTVYVASSGTTNITYTNLFTNREYYIKAQNANQTPVTLTGTIAAV